ncbi:hypothetical protein Nepgr_010891 [Nepenthes gracilis]|uniref:Pentatricopeptide repeat-containing protein n=1 Tax=Nepenthes gracilis TaxID=150966 RepID=A0AAD3SE21_NEPGR|nr:hypothetical protein Nepgr_010891 [Nepenthes gracilis]
MRFARSFSYQFGYLPVTRKSQQLPTRSTSWDAIKELHALLIRTQQHTDPYLIFKVLRSYCLSSSTLHKALFVFHEVRRPTTLLWNYMIRGLSQSDHPIEAIRMYNNMREKCGLNGDNLTFIFVSKACGRVSDIVYGQSIHVHALKLGFGLYLFVANALIIMYASCGALGLAQKVFDEMTERDLVSWNSLICGHSQCNRFKEVLDLFNAMQMANVEADGITMVKVILACVQLSDWEFADSTMKYIEENHVEICVYLGNTLIDMYGRRCLVELAQGIFDRMHEKNIVSWNTLIIGHAKAGNLVSARKLFNEMPTRDVISWTSMITAYSQGGQFSDAVKFFQEMMASKVMPDEITVVSVLSACGHLGNLELGEVVHDLIRKHHIREDIYVGNSLIDMYCKCGAAQKALEIFQGMTGKDSVSWTSVISGMAVNGFADSAFELFEQMLRERVRPTNGTFIGILLACAHAGLVSKGLEYFESMEKVFGLAPEMKHYGCMVDLLSRSGNLQRAYEFIEAMPVSPDAVLWRILLSACKLHGDVVLAEIASNKLLDLDPCNSGNYVLLSNAYASAYRWDYATKLRDLMEENYVQKPSGSSSIKVTGVKPMLEGPCIQQFQRNTTDYPSGENVHSGRA